MTRSFRRFSLVATLAMFGTTLGAQAGTPRGAADELLAADRSFASAAAGTDLISGIGAMLADNVIMPAAPPTPFRLGKNDVLLELRNNPANATSKVTWTPMRVEVSADGLHGYSFGSMTITLADGTTKAAKYLAYWIKGQSGWRVAAYKRVAAAAPTGPVTQMDPVVPRQLVAPVTDKAIVAAQRMTLVAAEQGFSDLAQQIGLGPAFRQCGASDAINLGRPNSPDVVLGNEAIAKLVQGTAKESDPRVHWAADVDAFIASSGDLGVTFGFIHPNDPEAAAKNPTGTPFFTVWRRVSGVWKYVAE